LVSPFLFVSRKTIEREPDERFGEAFCFIKVMKP
jgi:hypothetical protein